MTLESSAAFLCGGLKILTKPLNMVQGFPKVNFPYGISCYEKYGLFVLCIRSRQWEQIMYYINIYNGYDMVLKELTSGPVAPQVIRHKTSTCEVVCRNVPEW